MYVEKKKIGNGWYNYLRLSVRYGDKTRTKTVAYLGKGNLTKEALKKALAKYRPKADNLKRGTIAELKIESRKELEVFLSKEKLNKIEKISDGFNKKLKLLDEKTREDMFNDFLIVYAYNTNAIEGNTFTLRDTDLLLNKGITPGGKSLREINDHLNAKEAFNLILRKKISINHKNIIKIHSMLMKNIDKRVGDYRKDNVKVFGATFETSQAEYIKLDMDILLRWYKKNRTRLHPLILAAVFHHKFEKIHPFYDGNGRTGRLISNLILFQNGLPMLIVPDAQRKKYYASLATADKTDLDKLQPEHKEIIAFYYFNLLKTYNTIFGKWGK